MIHLGRKQCSRHPRRTNKNQNKNQVASLVMIQMKMKKNQLRKEYKRGNDKYKGMIPLICFNFIKIGIFSSKCPYANKSDSDE
jgi:hypothetical protein